MKRLPPHRSKSLHRAHLPRAGNRCRPPSALALRPKMLTTGVSAVAYQLLLTRTLRSQQLPAASLASATFQYLRPQPRPGLRRLLHRPDALLARSAWPPTLHRPHALALRNLPNLRKEPWPAPAADQGAKAKPLCPSLADLPPTLLAQIYQPLVGALDFFARFIFFSRYLQYLFQNVSFFHPFLFPFLPPSFSRRSTDKRSYRHSSLVSTQLVLKVTKL